jgi:hypothetical protein
MAKPLIITLFWIPLSGYWIYNELKYGMMERKIEGYAMVASEFFTSMLLLFLSIIGIFKVYTKTKFFTNGAIVCLLGGVISEVLIGVLGIMFEVIGKLKKRFKKDKNGKNKKIAKPGLKGENIKKNQVANLRSGSSGPIFRRRKVNTQSSFAINDNENSRAFTESISPENRRMPDLRLQKLHSLEEGDEDVTVRNFEKLMSPLESPKRGRFDT